jgi:hypothetical protein
MSGFQAITVKNGENEWCPFIVYMKILSSDKKNKFKENDIV